MLKRVFIFCLLFSCSSIKRNGSEKINYIFSDISGRYPLVLNVKYKENQVFVEKLLNSKENNDLLESTYVLSRRGTFNKKPFWIPTISQTKLWIDKKEYISEFKILPKKKVYALTTSEFNATKAVRFVKESYLCSFSILPVCFPDFLRHFKKSIYKGRKLQIGILFDQYPMTKTIYPNSILKPLETAFVFLEKEEKGLLYFNIELNNALMTLVTKKDMSFQSFHWVAQGLSLELR